MVVNQTEKAISFKLWEKRELEFPTFIADFLIN